MKTSWGIRPFTILLLISVLGYGFISNVPVGMVQAAGLTFTPQADAYVNSGSPSSNYGSATTLRTDASPVVTSYLRFSVQGTGGVPPTSAVLRIYANSSNPVGFDLHGVADNTWGETTITYANAPAYGGIAASSGPVTSATWLQVDVTALITGDGLFSFAMTSTSATATSFASKESGANAPQLIVTPASSTAPTATSTATPTPSVIASATPTPSILPSATPTSGVPPSPTPTSVILPSPTPTSVVLPSPVPTATPTQTSTGSVIVLAAGDISSCNTTGDSATAALIAEYPGAYVITLGDNAYPYGSSADFTNCYDPTWGSFKPETFPSIGNHEYLTSGASGYFGYFGPVAGDPSKGYYSFNLGAWHFIVINSNCSKVGTCGVGSPQETWVKADLAAHPTACTLAYWHHPRFSSGKNGSFTQMQPIWQDLYNAHAEIVLNGHDHDYERFAPQDPAGNLDPTNGITEIVAGTGGDNHTALSTILPNSLVQNADTFGVLKLTLNSSSYSWSFLPVAGKTFTDSGSAACH